MTFSPILEEENLLYIKDTVDNILDCTHDRQACSQGEADTRRILKTEMNKYCDEVQEDSFKTHSGAGTLVEKILCVFLCLAVILFSSAVSLGSILPASLSLITSLLVFSVFAYKFIFDGKKLDFITKAQSSKNLLGMRRSRSETQKRIVFVSRSDAPHRHRALIFGNKTAGVLTIASLLGNTVIFAGAMLFLFSGAPMGNMFFEILKTLSFAFVPVFLYSAVLVDTQKNASGISTSLIPSAVLLGIMKQFHDCSYRYPYTEVCVLIAGSDFSSKSGSYAFARKHKRLFRDVPTLFITVDEIADSRKISLFYKDGSGEKGSEKAVKIIEEASESLGIPVEKENLLLQTGSFVPFTKNHFPACSMGTSKSYSRENSFSEQSSDNFFKKDVIEQNAALIIETINYY